MGTIAICSHIAHGTLYMSVAELRIFNRDGKACKGKSTYYPVFKENV